MAGSSGSDGDARWRVFVSHTSELRDFPAGGSYVAAVERAVSACGHVIVDMADFPAADQAPAELCRDRVRGCEVYVGVLGTRYGSPVRDEPEVSYTELEFDTATKAGLDRLVFLLDIDDPGVGIPPGQLMDLKYGPRQDAFRRRVQDSGLVTGSFASPAGLGQLVERSLRVLTGRRRRGSAGGKQDRAAVVGEIPREPLGFQPRNGLLAVLDAGGQKSRISVVHALTGMRGVGKTHLAAAYARARIEAGWRLVAWINAEDLGGVLAGMTETAAALGLDTGGDAEAAGRAVRHRLEADGDRCLLVFDNATSPQLLQPFLPAAGAARVIITSNQQSVAYLGASVPVEVFTEPEALAFLADRTGLADAADARILAAELGYLPLALAQAAAVIASQRLPYATYADRLRRLPAAEMLAPVEAEQYPQGVAAAVLLALEAVQNRDDTAMCGAAMNLLAVLSAAGVPRTLVYAAARAGPPDQAGQLAEMGPEGVDRALARLAGASLLTFSLDGSSVSVHRLVMRVIRENLAASDSLTPVCQAAAHLLAGLARSLDQSWHENRGGVRDLVEQIMALHESSAGRPADKTLVHHMIQLRSWAVRSVNRLGESAAQSILIAEPLLADQEREQGTQHADTLATSNELAEAYRGAGRNDEAIALFEKTAAQREQVLGADHPDTLDSRSRLGAVYRLTGRTAEAIPLLEQTAAARIQLIGTDHPETLFTQNNLAAAYRVAGRMDEAISLHEQTLADRERVLGADHPDTLNTRCQLARDYQNTGRIAEAITLFEQTLAQRERVLGTDHPDTLRTRGRLAAAYRVAGRAAEAITLLEQTIAAQERVLGTDHPDTLASRDNLASATGGRHTDEDKEA